MKIEELRKRIDELIYEVEQQLKNEMLNREQPRCLALVRTKLQEAKMWSGKVLEATNNILPKEFRGYCDEREEQVKSNE